MFFSPVSFQVELCFNALGHLFTKDLCDGSPEFQWKYDTIATLKINKTDQIVVFSFNFKQSFY